MYRDEWARAAAKAYRELPDPVRAQVDEAINALLLDPYHVAGVRPLSGKFSGCLRKRVGDWRIIYKLDTAQQVLNVLILTPRKDAY